MWDIAQQNLFVGVAEAELHAFLYVPHTMHDSSVYKLGPMVIEESGHCVMTPGFTSVRQGYAPVLVQEGRVACQLQNGSVRNLLMKTHNEIGILSSRAKSTPERLRRCFLQCLALGRLNDAFNIAPSFRDDSYFHALANKAMEYLDVELAIRVYRHLGDAGMVLGLEEILGVRRRNINNTDAHSFDRVCSYN